MEDWTGWERVEEIREWTMDEALARHSLVGLLQWPRAVRCATPHMPVRHAALTKRKASIEAEG